MQANRLAEADVDEIDLTNTQLASSSTLARALQRAKDEHVRIRYKGEWYVTTSRTDPTVEYSLLASRDGKVRACSCKGFIERGWCKHGEALKAKLRRRRRR